MQNRYFMFPWFGGANDVVLSHSPGSKKRGGFYRGMVGGQRVRLNRNGVVNTQVEVVLLVQLDTGKGGNCCFNSSAFSFQRLWLTFSSVWLADEYYKTKREEKDKVQFHSTITPYAPAAAPC